MLLPSAASSLLLFTIGLKKRQNDLVSVNKLESKDTTVTVALKKNQFILSSAFLGNLTLDGVFKRLSPFIKLWLDFPVTSTVSSTDLQIMKGKEYTHVTINT